MDENKPRGGKQYSADWFFKGVLARLGEAVDKFAGRATDSPSSLATSGLIERLQPLLDDQKVFVEGKGFVVPHSIKLKMQWDKFSADGETSLDGLSESLTIAAIDHINDSLYYTYAPVKVEINSDYFTDGVKLTAGFEQFSADGQEVGHNLTIPNAPAPPPSVIEEAENTRISIIAIFQLKNSEQRRQLYLEPGKSISVGRTGSNQLVIDDVSVSKVHAAIVTDGRGTLSVADTGSTNGTLLNSERIPYGKSVTLAPGDVVTFGTVETYFEIADYPNRLMSESTDDSAESNSDDGAVEEG